LEGRERAELLTQRLELAHHPTDLRPQLVDLLCPDRREECFDAHEEAAHTAGISPSRRAETPVKGPQGGGESGDRLAEAAAIFVRRFVGRRRRRNRNVTAG